MAHNGEGVDLNRRDLEASVSLINGQDYIGDRCDTLLRGKQNARPPAYVCSALYCFVERRAVPLRSVLPVATTAHGRL